MTRTRLRGTLLVVLVWLAGAGTATAVGLLAVRLVAQQVSDPAVPALVSEALSAPSTAASPSALPVPSTPTTSAASRPAEQTRAFRSVGGSVGLACSGTTPRFLYAAPADGYALDERSVSGSGAEVRFEGPASRVRLELACASGRPVLLDERIDQRGSGSGSDD